ncbi:MAG TPA: hypothetical protein VGV38_01155 [Pyrinomonadaceae bacterium]|nr:hypothetical protein [Pyrinomonadaceae bacterium]
MAPDVDTDDLLARYVLGELSEAEEERVEERYLEDDLFFERLSLVEDE